MLSNSGVNLLIFYFKFVSIYITKIFYDFLLEVLASGSIKKLAVLDIVQILVEIIVKIAQMTKESFVQISYTLLTHKTI